jgi:type I restriction enzyme S subunit
VGSSLIEGWEIKKLGDICDIYNGSTPLRSKKEYWEDGAINWFTVNDIRKQGRIIEYTNQKISKEGFNNSSLKLLPINSILLCCTASVGEFAITKIELTTNQQFNGLVIKNSNELLPEFLFYFSSTLKEKLLNISGKATIDFISMTKLKKVVIPLPKLQEQEKIVTILDEAFSAIAKAKANAELNLQNAKKLFESYFRDTLSKHSGTIIKLGNVCEKVEYGSSSKSSTEGILPVLRMGNIQNRKLVWNDLKYSNNKEDNTKYLLKYNDVLFNRTNSPEWVGKTAIYKGEMPAIFAGYLIRIIIKKDLLDADYLNYFLNSKIAKNYGDTVVISSVNQANINGTKLKTYPIPLPCLKEQQKIVKKLNSLSEQTKKLESIYTQKLQDLKELKKSILQKAFNGELT